MGCRISTASRIAAEDVAPKQGKVVKVVKMEGEVLEFRKLFSAPSLPVPNPHCIGVSKQFAPEHLPSTYELKSGKVYYMVPLGSVTENNSTAATTRRIKIELSKQQLQELLTNQVSVQKLLSVSWQKTKPCSNSNVVDHLTNWKPKLHVIPEGTQH